MMRRSLLIVLIAVIAAALCTISRTRAAALWTAPACTIDQPDQTERAQRIDAAIDRSIAYLLSQQHEDGTWRSKTYGAMRDDLALTATIAKSLMLASPCDQTHQASERALTALRNWITSPPQQRTLRLEFPVYTAALAAIVLHRSGDLENREAAVLWLDLLREHQLTERLGWSPTDQSYGGWGYSVLPPRKPSGDFGARLPFESDLSSTLFAISALRLCGVSVDDPAIRSARVFIERCQNFSQDILLLDAALDDGGFHFAPACPVQNKAGIAGTDRNGRVRFHSYGTATADGVRALLAAGFKPDHPRVVAARRWLEMHFDAASNPGVFEPALEGDRNAPYFYYCWSIAHAFGRLEVGDIHRGDARINWAEALATELVRKQRDDGSWTNRFTFMKEDDPLVATPLAMAALAICREAIGGKRSVCLNPNR